ncbi:uncharacterized protein LOC111888380 [Lactuca sativa]|uniref:DUF569 domain-containing protein n=1 Tax=Lactuca sativa TaxID=4236 RepID=A0A9R1W863_LACSA|nr:uncharacterized protein LOC111888380 [Lactuca sativa]KAJ0218973.1 hypothetical protein LSAT_V11C300121540 [Lactuca sativa]
MEFFEKAVAVRLKSHLDKYLVAGDDLETVRQSRSSGSTRAARWLVEHVESNDHVIRLKSCYGRYLTATNTPFFFGTTGNKVVQSLTNNTRDLAIEWQPVRDGFQFKLKSFAGTYLRANGAVPPWRNTVSHDGSFTSSANNWILWDVEAVDVTEDEEEDNNNHLSIVPYVSAVADELSGLELGSPIPVQSPRFYRRHHHHHALSLMRKLPHFRLNFSIKLIKPRQLMQQQQQKQEQEYSGPSIMDLLRNAKAVRLRSHHGKFLHADDDQESVSQNRSATAHNNIWTIEFVSNTPDNVTIIRLKSCYDKYLTASNHHFLLGMTGKKVLQTVPNRLDSSVEWEPMGHGKQVKLKTRYGHYLRANGGLPPWRNSVTHDIPHRSATQGWINWQIEIVDVPLQLPAPTSSTTQVVPHSDPIPSSEPNSPSTIWSKSTSFWNQETIDWPLKREEGRAIYYHVISEDLGETEENENTQGFCISFKGKEVNELTRTLEQETRLHNITVCSQSPLDGKLYPLQLQLPPNNATMKVVVVQNPFQGEKEKRLRLRR